MREFELRRIARTEINRAQQEGAMATEIELGITFHQWITGSDERVRSSHRAQHNEVARVGEPFSNGLRRPLESGAPLGEVVNCRCRIAPWIMPEGFRAPTGKSWTGLSEFVFKSFFPGEIVPLGGAGSLQDQQRKEREARLAHEKDQEFLGLTNEEFEKQVPQGREGRRQRALRKQQRRAGTEAIGDQGRREALAEADRINNLTQSELAEEFGIVEGSRNRARRLARQSKAPRVGANEPGELIARARGTVTGRTKADLAELDRINNLTQSELFDEFKLNIDEIIALEGSGRFGTPSGLRRGDLVFPDFLSSDVVDPSDVIGLEPPINGVLVENITQLNAGLSGDTVELLLMEDGTQYVRKTYNSVSVRERERIVAQFGEAMGVPVAKTVSSDVDNQLLFEFIEGDAAGPLSWTLPDEVTELPGGRELGLFDFLISNTDRHGLNARITREGTLVGIDHGSQGIFSDDWLFGLSGFRHAGDSPFIRRWIPMDVGDQGQLINVLANSFTRAELQAAVDAAASTEMDEQAFAQVLNRVDMLLTANSDAAKAGSGVVEGLEFVDP